MSPEPARPKASGDILVLFLCWRLTNVGAFIWFGLIAKSFGFPVGLSGGASALAITLAITAVITIVSRVTVVVRLLVIAVNALGRYSVN